MAHSPADRLRQILLVTGACACLTPWVSSAGALFLGIALAVFLGTPWPERIKKLTPRLLAWSIVGLGGAMDLGVVGRVGAHGIVYTAIGIVGTLALAIALGRALRAGQGMSSLLGVGTAICGGSAIAAVAPVIRAKNEEVSVSLAVVFVLNATALALFPWLGHRLALTEAQFGLWSALAIHDTSSVVGASLQYGRQALEIATTVKLARALWIVPVTLVFAARSRHAGPRAPIKKPWFILGFLLTAAAVTAAPALRPVGQELAELARRLLVLTLFFIGTALNRPALRSVGAAPFVLGLVLWIIVASSTLGAIVSGWITL